MNIEITGRHVHITPDVEQYARSKAEKIAKFIRKDARVEIVLDHDHDRFQVEILVSGTRGPVVIGHIQHDQANAAIDLAIEKVDHQLRRMRDRKKDHRGPSMAGENLPAADEAEIDDVVPPG